MKRPSNQGLQLQNHWLARVAAVLFWLLVWQAAAMALHQPLLLSSPLRVAERLFALLGERAFYAALGYSLQALVRVRPLPGLLQKVDKYIQAMPECIESDKVTGEDCFVMRLVVRDIAQLDTLLDGLAEYAQCNTSVVKSSPVKRRLPPL